MIQDIPTPDQAGQEPSDEFKVKIGERLKQILGGCASLGESRIDRDETRARNEQLALQLPPHST